MGSETIYEARSIPTEGDIDGDMPRRLTAGPMHLLVYVREDVVAETVASLRARLAACEEALRKIADDGAEEYTVMFDNERTVMVKQSAVQWRMDLAAAALNEPARTDAGKEGG